MTILPINMIVFWILFALCWLSWVSSPLALGMGIFLGLFGKVSHGNRQRYFTSLLLQICVVGLGFNMNFYEVLKVGSTGVLYTALSLIFVLVIGLWLGKLFKVKRCNSFLITVGTAICGGSAIVAVGSVLDAEDEEMSVSLGTIFLLNAVAILVFPLLGSWVGLSQEEFGLWSALAIQDTSSVVAVGSHYGPIALTVGTTIKLARSLWIIPLSLGIAFFEKRDQKQIKWPWFIGFFLLAALLNSVIIVGQPLFQVIYRLARSGLTATLFLIGSGISQSCLQTVGIQPLLQGLTLWVLISILSLFLIERSLIPIPLMSY